MSEPRSYPGWAQISKEEFFAIVGRLDVHPSPQGPWDNRYGYVSHWKLRDEHVIGLSDGGTHLQERRFFIPEKQSS